MFQLFSKNFFQKSSMDCFRNFCMGTFRKSTIDSLQKTFHQFHKFFRVFFVKILHGLQLQSSLLNLRGSPSILVGTIPWTFFEIPLYVLSKYLPHRPAELFQGLFKKKNEFIQGFSNFFQVRIFLEISLAYSSTIPSSLHSDIRTGILLRSPIMSTSGFSSCMPGFYWKFPKRKEFLQKCIYRFS